jgi:uncharacterized membrane protein
MRHKPIITTAPIIISLAFLILRAFAAAPCARMTMTVSSTTVTRGAMANATGSIKNCSKEQETLSVTYSAEGPCDFKVSGVRSITLAAGETQSTTIPVMVPAVACPGVYTLRASAFSGKTRVATASIKVTVQ